MKRSTFFQFAAPSIIIMTLLMVIPLIMAIWLGMNYITFNNINSPQFIGFTELYRGLKRQSFLAILSVLPLYTWSLLSRRS